MPVIRWRVVCAFFDVMLSFAPTRRFSSVDLPTFGRPTIATRPQRKSRGRVVAIIAAPSRRLPSRPRRPRPPPPARPPAGSCPLPAATIAERGNPAFDGERLRVRLADDRRDGVFGHRDAPRLEPFLQPRLGILAGRRRDRSAEIRRVDPLDDRARSLEAGVDEHRAENSLERVGEDRRSRAPPLLCSPSPSRIARADRVLLRASPASVSRLTRFARTRDRSPSWICGKRS